MKWSLKRGELLMLSGGMLTGVIITLLALYKEPLGRGAWWGMPVFAVLIAVTMALGLPSSSGIISIAHTVTVSGFLALGLVPGLIASAGGAILADIIKMALARPLGYKPPPLRRVLLTMSGNVGVQTCGLLAGAGVFRLLGGSAPLYSLRVPALPLLALFVVYFITNLSCLAILLWAQQHPLPLWKRADRWHVIVLELVPLPLSVIIANAYNSVRIEIFLLPSAALVGSAFTIWQAGRARMRLQQQVRELSTLNTISQALSNLDLLELLGVIHAQVARLMPSDNFYIALCDLEHKFIDFAFVIENGARIFRPGRPFSNGLAEYVIRHHAPLLIQSNVAEMAHRLGVESIEREAQSWLGVPMIAENRVLGVIGIQSYEQANVYDERQMEILSNIAAQAAMAVRSAQLYGQARQRAAELAMLNTISAAVSSTLDLDRVLELIVSSMMSLMGSQKSAIFLLDETQGVLRLEASKGLSDEYVLACERLPLTENGLARVLQEKKPILVADIHADPRLAHFQELVTRENLRAFAGVPLIVEGEVIGVLATFFPDVHYFSLAEADLLTTFANQGAATVANARLYASTQRALVRHVEELSALEAIGRELSITLNLDLIINLVLDCAMQATGATLGTVAMIESKKEFMHIVSCRGCTPSLAETGTTGEWPIDVGLIGRAISTQRSVLVEDVDQDSDYIPTLGAKSNNRHDVLSQLVVPIVRKEKVMGVINLESTHLAAFDSQHAAFVGQLATQSAIAIQNAQLFQQVAEGHDRLQAVMNSTREGILMLDVTGRVVLANPMIEELWGMSRAKLEGHDLRDLLRGPGGRLAAQLGYSREELLRLLAQLPTGPTELGKETCVLAAPRHRVIERVGAPVMDEDGHVWGWMLVLRDVTEEKELERMREDVTHMIVHDLRSPLAAILGSLELIENVTKKQPQDNLLVQALDIAAQSTQRLRNMVDSLLDISRLEAGQTRLDQQPHTLAALVHSATSLVSPLVDEAGLMLEIKVPDNLPPVEVDENLIERVLINLLDNAIKFTPLGGRITVMAQPENGAFVRCSIHDTGPGIPHDYLDRIFKRFVQIPGQNGRRQGTGLGLAFCRLAVEAHGGRIWVESEERRGSHFHFTLPTAQSGVKS
ncbi:MAG: GAF domain-containing protein [Chloroflexota bacterium]|nr:GAF domain-containing protein [Chloroflexota bacterium]